MSKDEFIKLSIIFLIWKLVVLSFANLSQILFPLQTNFLGGGLLNYLRHPNFWGFINFDGEHYLSVARDGYLPLTYFYFPLYPTLIKLFAFIIGGSFFAYAISGLILSNLFLFLALIGIYKLALRFYTKRSAYLSMLFLLAFPASFFLGAYYNDSLFLALAVWGFYFAIKRYWFLAIIFAGLASATRVVGIALAAGVAVEYLFGEFQLTKPSPLRGNPFKVVVKIVKSLFIGLFGVSGLLVYMVYLHVKTGSALEFFRNVAIFGEQRSTAIILLPQVFYRYFIKVLPNINYNYFPAVFTAYLEIASATFVIIVLTVMIFRLRAGFTIYSILAFIIPALSGSFSSMPRYLLVIFPIFLLMGKYLSTKSKAFSYALFALLLLGTLIALSLFIRGYFVS